MEMSNYIKRYQKGGNVITNTLRKYSNDASLMQNPVGWIAGNITGQGSYRDLANNLDNIPSQSASALEHLKWIGEGLWHGSGSLPAVGLIKKPLKTIGETVFREVVNAFSPEEKVYDNSKQEQAFKWFNENKGKHQMPPRHVYGIKIYQSGGVAKTPSDYSLGILKGKTIFPFNSPGPKQMTMNTPAGVVPYPIEYKGYTNNQLTDYGVAHPGDNFTVNGDTVVENKLSNMKPTNPQLWNDVFNKVKLKYGGYAMPNMIRREAEKIYAKKKGGWIHSEPMMQSGGFIPPTGNVLPQPGTEADKARFQQLRTAAQEMDDARFNAENAQYMNGANIFDELEVTPEDSEAVEPSRTQSIVEQIRSAFRGPQENDPMYNTIQRQAAEHVKYGKQGLSKEQADAVLDNELNKLNEQNVKDGVGRYDQQGYLSEDELAQDPMKMLDEEKGLELKYDREEVKKTDNNDVVYKDGKVLRKEMEGATKKFDWENAALEKTTDAAYQAAESIPKNMNGAYEHTGLVTYDNTDNNTKIKRVDADFKKLFESRGGNPEFLDKYLEGKEGVFADPQFKAYMNGPELGSSYNITLDAVRPDYILSGINRIEEAKKKGEINDSQYAEYMENATQMFDAAKTAGEFLNYYKQIGIMMGRNFKQKIDDSHPMNKAIPSKLRQDFIPENFTSPERKEFLTQRMAAYYQNHLAELGYESGSPEMKNAMVFAKPYINNFVNSGMSPSEVAKLVMKDPAMTAVIGGALEGGGILAKRTLGENSGVKSQMSMDRFGSAQEAVVKDGTLIIPGSPEVTVTREQAVALGATKRNVPEISYETPNGFVKIPNPYYGVPLKPKTPNSDYEYRPNNSLFTQPIGKKQGKSYNSKGTPTVVTPQRYEEKNPSPNIKRIR